MHHWQKKPALRAGAYARMILLVLAWLAAACQPLAAAAPLEALPPGTEAPTAVAEVPQATPFPTRPVYQPGELVDYVAQTGDTLPAVAIHFNARVAEILAANSFIPPTATTLPPGMPMKIPIYYAPFWGSPFQILPDSLFVNGPAQVGFSLEEFVASKPGWLKYFQGYASDATRSGAQLVQLVAQNYSVSPRLLLALLEYQAGALSQPVMPEGLGDYPLGIKDWQHTGLYMQLVGAANTLNNGYYGWRDGTLVTLEHPDGKVERPDPWQNAASVAVQYYFSILFPQNRYDQAIGPDGLARTYRDLFGDPWLNAPMLIPGSLEQPSLSLPFEPGHVWAFTGGPHTGWGDGDPLAALDFAPGAVKGGCVPSDEWVVAVAPGVVARSEPALAILDLDGDGDERTGWTIFYFHLAIEDRVQQGAVLKIGDHIGHPSCEGGRATGTHVHIARRYNGEWIPASGLLAFNLEGWVAQSGNQPYQGHLNRNARSIVACVCSDQYSQIQSDEH